MSWEPPVGSHKQVNQQLTTTLLNPCQLKLRDWLGLLSMGRPAFELEQTHNKDQTGSKNPMQQAVAIAA